MGLRGQSHAVSALPPPPEGDLLLSVQEAGLDQGPVWTGVENLAPTGIRSSDHPAFQPVVGCYRDCAIL